MSEEGEDQVTKDVVEDYTRLLDDKGSSNEKRLEFESTTERILMRTDEVNKVAATIKEQVSQREVERCQAKENQKKKKKREKKVTTL
jgi:hypothetical protein